MTVQVCLAFPHIDITQFRWVLILTQLSICRTFGHTGVFSPPTQLPPNKPFIWSWWNLKHQFVTRTVYAHRVSSSASYLPTTCFLRKECWFHIFSSILENKDKGNFPFRSLLHLSNQEILVQQASTVALQKHSLLLMLSQRTPSL